MGCTVEKHAEQAPILSTQSEGYTKQFQTLENDVVIPTSTDANPVINRTSIDTTASVRSIIDSILSLYGHESLCETPSEYQGEALETGSMQVDQARVPRITKDHMRKSAVVDLHGPDSPLVLPCTSKYSLDPSTASNDEAIGDLEVEYSNHLAATELGIPTESYEFNSDQLQYDGERVVSGSMLRDSRTLTFRQSYARAVTLIQSFAEVPLDGKDWHYTLYTSFLAVKICLQCSRPVIKAMRRVRMKFASTVRSKRQRRVSA